MKKPKITEGPWFPLEYGGYMIIQDEDHYGGLNVLDQQHFPLAENNAKACGAVPELIDALVKCYDFIQELKDHGIDNWSEEENVKQALKKAGCTDE